MKFKCLQSGFLRLASCTDGAIHACANPGILYYSILCLISQCYALVYFGHMQCSYRCTCSSPRTVQSCMHRVRVLWNSSFFFFFKIQIQIFESLRKNTSTHLYFTDDHHSLLQLITDRRGAVTPPTPPTLLPIYLVIMCVCVSTEEND